MTLTEEVARVARGRAQAIEERLRVAVACGSDLAVSETWDGRAVTLQFELVTPGTTPPPNCTLYLASKAP